MELWEVVRENVVTVALPLLMLVFGLFTRIGLPKRVNWFVGYRTPLACKNQDTWAFAHRYWGKLMIVFGLILTVLAIVGLPLLARDTLDPTLFLTISAVATLLSVLLTIIPTEIALRKEFDKDGQRRR